MRDLDNCQKLVDIISGLSRAANNAEHSDTKNVLEDKMVEIVKLINLAEDD